MTAPLLAGGPTDAALLAAWAVAVLAAFTGLGLLRGIVHASPSARRRRRACASLAIATGVLSAHFIILAGNPALAAAAHDSGWLLAALGLTGGAALAAQLALGGGTSRARRVAAAGFLAGGLCVGPALALMALPAAASIAWQAPMAVGAWLVAAAGTVLAIALAGRGGLPRERPRAATRRMAIAALLLGSCMVGADLAMIHAAHLPEGLSSASSGGVAGDALVMLAAVGGPSVLALLLLASTLEIRFGELLARARDELQRASRLDGPTGLPNRLLFEERLQRAVHRADRQSHRLALLCINIDGLPGAHDAGGLASADARLREIAQRLRAIVGTERAARAGADEFLLLIDDDPDDAEASRLAAQVLVELARPCGAGREPSTLSASIGIAMYPEHGALSRLIPHATAALNAARNMGGATYCFFEAGMVAGRREGVELLRDLRCAIEQRELELFYQPKIHAPSGQITGAEALMRWHHPQRGLINPAVFIPLAEHCGLINALGQWVIEDACRQIRAWRNEGLRMRVAINLSVHQLRQPDLASRIAAALQRHRLEPRVLTCEITESVAMDDSYDTLKVIEQLAAVGVHLSIDDFGTGYSNLSCLRKLPAEELKIDRGFVLDLETSGDARAIVDAVVKLAQAIGLKVVAEGVETEQQQHILRQLGCDELQGYLFARPMSARALAHWAMSHEGPRALDFRASLFGETRAVELV